ncbi:MAG: molecular chaperone HtpG [Rhodospirillales bacterium]|nr:molecular chaperone HtpG [Rhodospirillales bacterium]
MDQAAEKHEFGAEVGRLLDLVVHSLYSEREIFLRELVANAADATDRRRFEALTDSNLALPENARIRIVADKAARTLTISDSGIGMRREELIAHLGTIARSGTRDFGERLDAAPPQERPSLIGQFGVGFYAAFMVAERVAVTSRHAGEQSAWRWESEGRGGYELAPSERETAGTDVVLHIKADAEEYLDPARIEAVVRKWADHVTVPIVILRDGKEETANEGTALWRRPKAELSEEDATSFYRGLGNLFDKPWATLHWRAEGALEFFALLFVPASPPLFAANDERRSRVRLHVRRMFITDEAELLPPWLRFVQGVVDTEDLPLNVSREMLQATPVLARIRRAVTNRVLTELTTRAKDAEAYAAFWEKFGAVLKESAWDEAADAEKAAALWRFRSTAVEGWTSLADYVSRMKPEQESIYVLAGEDTATLAHATVLEGFQARGIEVLLAGDPIDAFWPDRFDRFDGKKIRRAGTAQEELAKLPPLAEAEGAEADVGDLLRAMKSALGEAVSDVRATSLLAHSAVMLVAAGGVDLQVQRMLRRAGRAGPERAAVLEINPRHPLIATLAARVQAGEAIEHEASLLLDLARIGDGDAPRDPAAFARAVENALAK